MSIKRNLSFLSFNLIFTITFTIFALSYLSDTYFIKQSFLIILFFGNAIILVFPRIMRAITTNIAIIFLAFYFGLQSVYHRSFNQYGLIQTALSFQSSMFAFADSAFETMVISDAIFFILPILSLYISFRLIKNKWVESKPIHQVLMLILFSTLSFTQLERFYAELDITLSNPAKIQDKKVIYANIPNTNHFVSQFGLTGLLLREFDWKTQTIEIIPEVTINDQISILFNNKNENNVNLYTDMFKGKNLLLIQAESLNNLVIDPVLTPTLYKFKSEGIFVDGFNSPLLAGSTSDTEFMVNTSLLPANNGKITFNDYADNKFPHTLANTFTNHGYYSMASHNNYGIYYNRTNMLPNLGYTFYDAIGINAEDQAEDSYVIDHIKWIMYEHAQYFSFWVTYTAHQPYSLDTLSETMQSDYAKVEARYPNLSEAEKVYFTKTMNLEHGLKKLLIDYKNAERLDDMVIIIYGDHYPKGLFSEDGLYDEICKTNGNTRENCFDTPLIIWNSQIEAQVIHKASSPLDIAPTIYDLFGLEYQDEITLGHSVFDPEYHGFNFDEFNIIQTNDYIYDTLRDTIVLRNWTKSEETYRLEAEALYQRLLLGYKVVENNYFASREYRERFVSN